MAFELPDIDKEFFRQDGGFANMETLQWRVEFASKRVQFDFRNIEPDPFSIDVAPFLAGTLTF